MYRSGTLRYVSCRLLYSGDHIILLENPRADDQAEGQDLMLECLGFAWSTKAQALKPCFDLDELQAKDNKVKERTNAVNIRHRSVVGPKE
jgi:hypothetical protein